MKYLSVCSGIEAATVAWHHMGWEPVAFSEIEKFPSAVLAHHYPSVPNWGDMTRFKEWPDANVDVLVGGTPCQSFSVAGLRKGLDDPRGNLMLTFGSIAQRYRPQWLVWENVPGVLSSNGGRDFGSFLGMLGQLGYGFAYRVLDAQYFGVAQRRRRVFVVGHLGDWHRAAAVLFERHSLSGHPAPSRQARKGTASGVAGSTRAGGWPAEVSPTLYAQFGSKQGMENQHAFSGCGLFVPGSVQAFDAFNQADTGDLSKTVAARSDQDTASLVSGCWWDGEDVAPTLTKQNASGAQRMPDKANFGAVLQPAHTFKVRGGCEGGGKGYLGQDEQAFTLAATQDQFLAQPITFGAQMSEPQTDVDMVQTLQAKNPMAVAHVDVMPTMTSGGPSASSHNQVSGQMRDAYMVPVAFGGDIARSLTARHDSSPCADRGMDVVAVAMRESGQGYWMQDEIAGTLRAEGEDRPSRPSHVIQQHAMQVRRLTPIECSRLQGFPDTYLELTYGTQSEAHASQILHELWKTVGAYAREGWRPGIVASLLTPQILLAGVYGGWISWEMASGCANASRAISSQVNYEERFMLRLQEAGQDGRSPYQRESFRQLAAELGCSLSQLPLEEAQAREVLQCSELWQEAQRTWPLRYAFATEAQRRSGKLNADGPRYKALGNSMAVPVMRHIGERINEVSKL